MNITAPRRRARAVALGGGTAGDRARRGRRAATLVAACVVAAGAALFAPASALADVGDGPGGLTLDPTSGSTTAEIPADFTSVNACPATSSGASVQFVDEGPPLALLVQLTPNIDPVPTQAPVSGPLDGLGPGGFGSIFNLLGMLSGDYQVALVCYGANGSDLTAVATTWIHVDLEGDTWNVIGGEDPGDPGAVTTTTTLAAEPTSAPAGQPVALTATVTGDGAAGSVEFLDGETSLGTADVTGGAATLTVDSLSVGAHPLTAEFTPTDPEAFTPSTSSAVTVTITSVGGGQTGGQQLNVTIPQGGGDELTMTVATDPVSLEQVGEELTFRGELGSITVTDGRAELAGWEVTGSSTDFTSGANNFGGEQLGWTPAVVEQNEAGDVAQGQVVLPGAPGLGAPATLASADANKGAGASTLGGDLELQVPAETPAGDYSATLTVTLVSK